MLKVGLTGGIGSGKTAVSNLFKDLGIPVIDTDVISHELTHNDKPTLNAIIDTFGNHVLTTDGALDRKKLAHIVFNEKEKKQSLEKILHPKIRHEVNKQIRALSLQTPPLTYCIIVIPLLLETDFSDLIDHILVVIADEDRRVERIMLRDNRKPDEIHSIIRYQVNDEERLNMANTIIENNGDFNQLQKKVHQLNKKYQQI